MLKIREAAERAGIETPYALRKATGVNLSTCQKLWRGMTGLQVATLIRIADGLGCRLDDLVDRGTK